MYHIYTTPAFVLGSREAGEVSRVYALYTRDLGLIHAHAQGVRRSASKLRGHLRESGQVTVSLVRGRERWRIVGAEEVLPTRTVTPEEKRLVARILATLKRFAAGEESDPNLYSEVVQALGFLSTNNLSKADRQLFEIASIARIMNRLGYISKESLGDVATTDFWESGELSRLHKREPEIIGLINAAFYHSHL